MRLIQVLLCSLLLNSVSAELDSAACEAHVVLTATPTLNGKTIVRGAGGSFPNRLFQDAMFAYGFANAKATVQYTSTGSSGGKCRIKDYCISCDHPFTIDPADAGNDGDAIPNVDFAGSDSLLKTSDYASYPDLQMYPAVAGAVVPIFNVPGVDDLILNTTMIAQIFRKCLNTSGIDCAAGAIQAWSDPKILELNPSYSAALQACGDIKVVVRADKSGTTEIFKKALRTFETEFANQFPDPSSKSWPGVDVIQRDMNEGVAAAILGISCTIGYSVLAEAQEHNLNMVRIKKSTGVIVAPNSESVSFAAMEKGLDFGLNGDTVDRMTADIQGSLRTSSWPIAGYTYFVLRKNTTRAGGNCETRLQTFKFLEWFYTNSVVKSLVASHGYAMLPSEVRSKVWSALKNEFRCDGKLIAVEEAKVLVSVEVNSALESDFSLTKEVYTLVDSSLDLSVAYSDVPLVPVNMLTNLGVPKIKLGWRHNMIVADGIAISPYAGIGMGVIFNLCGAVEPCLFWCFG